MAQSKLDWFKSKEQQKKEEATTTNVSSNPDPYIRLRSREEWWHDSDELQQRLEQEDRRRRELEQQQAEAARQRLEWWAQARPWGSAMMWDSVPQPARAVVEEYATSVEDEVGTSRLVNSHLVGCDPEFVVLNNGRYINLADYISADGPIGYDHNGRVAELRPKPARGTYALTKRIREMLFDGRLKPLQPYKWRAGAMANIGTQVQSLGGHIHLDKPMDWALVKALDRLTVSLERLDILPRAESLNRRRNGGYGHWGDVRTEHGRMEYRVMPSWLFDPRTTFTCLTLAKLVSVDPKLALDMFPARTMSWGALQKFVEAFKSKDINAARWCEKFEDVKSIQRDPDQNIVKAWEQLGF